MTGRYFEDFRIGERITTGGRTLTAADIAGFAALTGDHNRLHADEDLAAAGPFRRPVAHGLLGMGIAVGLIEQTGVLDGTSLAMLQIQEWSFRRPLHAGTRVSAQMVVTGLVPSTRDPGRGVVIRHIALLDAAARVLQEGSVILLVRTRAAALA
jgi:acyl dehydratase